MNDLKKLTNEVGANPFPTTKIPSPQARAVRS
jgi:hypothetical protein